jgi:hypothetical protein
VENQGPSFIRTPRAFAYVWLSLTTMSNPDQISCRFRLLNCRFSIFSGKNGKGASIRLIFEKAEG